MILECHVRLVALSAQNSFNRPTQSNIYLGIRKTHIQEPRLVLVTRNSIIEFKLIDNIKRIYQKEMNRGKIGIEFQAPPHQILINSTREELLPFTELLRKLTNRKIVEKLDYIPVIPKLDKPKLRPTSKTSNTSGKSQIINQTSITNSIIKNPTVKLNSNLKVLDLPNYNISNLPIKLGQISIESINLEGNMLTNDSLKWLEELPIRRSLQFLNLAGNKIKSFPCVLIDFTSLYSLNLRDNSIQYLPGDIGQLMKLRYLNLSGNDIRFLPASITCLKLEEIDLTYNMLTNNVMTNSPAVKENIRSQLRLLDLAALSLNAYQRRFLTYRDCPPRLLDRLRCSSICICGTKSTPFKPAQYYKAVIRVKFATTYKIHPQKKDFEEAPIHSILRKGNGIDNIFLQYHFCTFTDRCDKVKVENYQSSYSCYSLSPSI